MHYSNAEKPAHANASVLSRILIIILFAASILLLTSCGSSSGTSSAGNGNAAATKNYVSSGTSDSAAGVSESRDEGTAAYGRKLTKELSVTAKTDDFSGMDSLLRTEAEKAGGYIESSSMNTYDNVKSEQLTIRIPSDRLDDYDNLISNNCTVTEKNESTEDITDTYNETESELESLQQEMDALNAMLAKADNVTDTIAIQDRISDVRSRIGTLKAQLKSYDSQVSYSRVSVYLTEDSIVRSDSQTVGERISYGFRSALKLLGDFFVGLFVFVVSASPILAVLAAIVILAVYLSRRSSKKRKQKQQEQRNDPAYIDAYESSGNEGVSGRPDDKNNRSSGK